MRSRRRAGDIACRGPHASHSTRRRSSRRSPGASSRHPAAHPSAVSGLRTALALWRGRPYDELDEWPPTVRETGASGRTPSGALEGRSDADLEAGTASVAELEQLASDAPLRERRWFQLMLALYRTGRQAEALRAYERARTSLRDQLGIEPGIELEGLDGDSDRDPALDHGRATPASGAVTTTTRSSAAAIERLIEQGEAHFRAGEPSLALDAFSEGGRGPATTTTMVASCGVPSGPPDTGGTPVSIRSPRMPCCSRRRLASCRRATRRCGRRCSLVSRSPGAITRRRM